MSERLDGESYDGAWAGGVQAVNALIDDLAAPTAEIARVLDAVAEGDLSQHMALEIDGRRLRGEFRRIGRTVNRMVDQLSSFAEDRKSTRLNSSHANISYAAFCLKKKT